ncbi:SpoIID/LytB domain-containing protein [Candidatus Atelocyanobacterium thalassae]|uniref:Sporulation stage II protein D amidase enhancer LytB N-terminal domain-containing protein n=1 Tax=cyanobacterium endosymbiont of Braarudosphaera bigelowii TaxID=1285375 RepID=A0ABN6K3S9_9CHRO|nr:SpoIID/LytB domain-containing protein [Candidatus Atelocyanobacterium thalassa]BDA39851.1 hypothetical protein CPARK_000069100 [cyanobacterium endosymbiont of Braarudosphaera bigelowii]
MIISLKNPFIITLFRSLIFYIILFSCSSTHASTELRVAIKKNVKTLYIGSSSPANVINNQGKQIGTLAPLNSFKIKLFNENKISLKHWKLSYFLIEPQGKGVVWINNRWYRGKILLISQGKTIIVINLVDLNEYLYSVVGGESYPTWPKEALKAQAIVSRTYALFKTSTSGNIHYDLDTTTKTQIYRGIETESLATHNAVKVTSKEVLTHNGKLILSVFHSSSGGHTENVENVWNSSLSYLQGVPDYDQLSPVFSWNQTFSSTEIGQLINGLGTIYSLVPGKVTPSGRIVTLNVLGDQGSRRVSGIELRKILKLKSTGFRISIDQGLFTIRGRGFGHGIGMSQWGSYYLAKQNIPYYRILSHYYQNSDLTLLKEKI